MPGNASRENHRVYGGTLKKIYPALPVMGGLLGQQKVSYGWVLGLQGHQFSKQL
jgi:hypothetical protein